MYVLRHGYQEEEEGDEESYHGYNEDEDIEDCSDRLCSFYDCMFRQEKGWKPIELCSDAICDNFSFLVADIRIEFHEQDILGYTVFPFILLRRFLPLMVQLGVVNPCLLHPLCILAHIDQKVWFIDTHIVVTEEEVWHFVDNTSYK